MAQTDMFHIIPDDINPGDRFTLKQGGCITVVSVVKERTSHFVICEDERGRRFAYGLAAFRRCSIKKMD